MVSFEFSKEIEKHVFRLVTSVGERGIEPQTSGFYALMLYH